MRLGFCGVASCHYLSGSNLETEFAVGLPNKANGRQQKQMARLPREIGLEFINAPYKKDWVVFAKWPFNSPQSSIEYLNRYTHKIAISKSSGFCERSVP